MTVRLDAAYAPSKDVVSREIEGELLIVPLAAGVGEAEDDLFTLNETGRAVWRLLDGRMLLKEAVAALAREYEAPLGEIEGDVIGLMEELIKRRMVVEVPGGD